MSEKCECINWAGELIVSTKHHINCSKFSPRDELIESKRIIVGLLRGMQDWAHDEDGVHRDAWVAYKEACSYVIKPHMINEEQKNDDG